MDCEHPSKRFFKRHIKQLSPTTKHKSSSPPLSNEKRSKLCFTPHPAEHVNGTPHALFQSFRRSSSCQQQENLPLKRPSSSGEVKKESLLALFFKRSRTRGGLSVPRSQSLDNIFAVSHRIDSIEEECRTERKRSLIEGKNEKESLNSSQEDWSVSSQFTESSVFQEGMSSKPVAPVKKRLMRRSSSCGNIMELFWQQQADVDLPKSRTFVNSRSSPKASHSSPIPMGNTSPDEDVLKPKSTKSASKPSLEDLLQHLAQQGDSDLQSQLKIAREDMPASWMDIVANSEKLSQGHHELQSAIWELISNELGNIKILRILCYFRLILLQLQGLQYLRNVDVELLFQNITEVLDACERFWYTRLRRVYLKSRESGNLLNALDVNDAFLSFPDYFEPYVAYCAREKMSLSYLNSLKQNQKFAVFLQWCHCHPECERQELLSLMNRPTQQMTRYQLLLARVESKMQSPMITRVLSDRITEVKDFVMLINDTAKLREEEKTVMDICAKISGCVMYESLPSEAQFHLSKMFKLDLLNDMVDMPPTVCQQRVQVHSGPCGVLKRQAKEVRGFLYLLTDLLLITVKGEHQKQKLLKQPMLIDRVQIGLSLNPACFLLMYYGDFGFEFVVDAVWMNADTSENAREWQRRITEAQHNYQRLRKGEQVKSHPRIPQMPRCSVAQIKESSVSDQRVVSVSSISSQEVETVHSSELMSEITLKSHQPSALGRTPSNLSTSQLSSSSGVQYRPKRVSLTSLHSSRPISEVSSFSCMSFVSASSDRWSQFDSSSDDEMQPNGCDTLPCEQSNLHNGDACSPHHQSENFISTDQVICEENHCKVTSSAVVAQVDSLLVSRKTAINRVLGTRKQGRDENGTQSVVCTHMLSSPITGDLDVFDPHYMKLASPPHASRLETHQFPRMYRSKSCELDLNSEIV